MSQTTRVIVAIVVLVVVIAAVFGVEMLRRDRATVEGEATVVPGAIPIYRNGALVAAFNPDDLQALDQVSFIDEEEGKTQEGWLLRDVLLLHFDEEELDHETTVKITSSSRGKHATFTWAEVEDRDNWVMFDLSGRGTLKLVSTLERLDIRDEWIQDVDLIEVVTP